MGIHDSNDKFSSGESRIDYVQIAEGVEDFREMLRTMLAAAKAEGLNDEQAGDVIAAMFRGMHREEKTDG